MFGKYEGLTISELSPEPEETERMDKETREMATQFIVDINKLFEQKYGLFVSEDDLPSIEINPKAGGVSYSGGIDEKGHKLNVIEVGSASDVLDGPVLGEEMAHFYRSKFKPETTEEILTDEFFGWIGRRLFYEATLNKDGTSDFFKREPIVDMAFLGKKSEIVRRLNNLRKKIRNLTEQYNAEEDSVENEAIFKEGKDAVEEREDLLTHYRGYYFASKINLSRITNWKMLFSLSNEEIRRRFFRNEPDYSRL